MTVILYLARSPLTATYKLQAMHAAVRIKIINLKLKPAAGTAGHMHVHVHS